MPNKRPDIYEHNNPDLAFVDTRFVRGGRRVVDDREELYGLVVKADQLLEQVTIVRILSDEENDDATTEVLLVDADNIGTTSGWLLQVAPEGGGPAYDDTAVKARLGATTAQDSAAPLSSIATTKPILAITSQGLQGFDTFAQTQLVGATTVELNKRVILATDNTALQNITVYGRGNTLQVADGKNIRLSASTNLHSQLFEVNLTAVGSSGTGAVFVSKDTGLITGVPTALEAPRLINSRATLPVRFLGLGQEALTLSSSRLEALTNDSADVAKVATVYLLGSSSIGTVGPNINVVQVGGSTPGTARDPFAVGDNAAITEAVMAASNTWVDGDLIAFGSDALRMAGAPPAVSGQNASILVGTADVATMDEFDKKDAGGYAWRYRYSRRNDGTSGWTRTAKTA